MPIGDPLGALEHQFQMEDASLSPAAKMLVQLASLLPLGWPLDKAIGKLKERLAADSLDRIRLILETCMNEIRKHGETLRQLREALNEGEAEVRVNALKELLLDGARKAEDTRDRERV